MMSNRKSKLPVLLATAVMVAGVALSLMMSNLRLSALRSKARAAFQNKAETLRNAVRREMQLEVEVLESIRSLHAISEQIRPEQFEEFLKKGMAYQRRTLQGFGFVQRMNHRERLLREASGNSGGALNLEIVELGEEGRTISAPQRPVYYPLTYQTPEQALGVPRGFDFGSRSGDRDAVEKLQSVGSTVVGGPLIDVFKEDKDKADADGWYVFAPILYERIPGTPLKAREPGYLVGFAVGTIRPDVLLERALARLPELNLKASLTRAAAPPGMSHSARQTEKGSPYEFDDVIRMAGSDWFLVCRPGSGFARETDSVQPLLILILGLTVTGFISGEFLLMARRTGKIERKVSERTAQLREAKQKLESEIAERKRLEEEILEVGNREKLRVGQDLHDSLGQKLTAAVLRGRALVKSVSELENGYDSEVKEVVDLTKSALSQVRRLAKGLAPVELGNEGLSGALGRLVRDTREIHGVECELDSESGGLDIDKAVAVHLYHIAQEAVTNALRHGKAGHILMKLEEDGEELRLTVRDDGTGIGPERGHEGLGMRIMRHRADMIGGRLEVRNAAEGGTEVCCVVGLEERNYEMR